MNFVACTHARSRIPFAGHKNQLKVVKRFKLSFDFPTVHCEFPTLTQHVWACVCVSITLYLLKQCCCCPPRGSICLLSQVCTLFRAFRTAPSGKYTCIVCACMCEYINILHVAVGFLRAKSFYTHPHTYTHRQRP